MTIACANEAIVSIRITSTRDGDRTLWYCGDHYLGHMQALFGLPDTIGLLATKRYAGEHK